MKTEIFTAEISLNLLKSKNDTTFNDTQLRAYLGGLSACYDEVMILNMGKHVFVLATGQSPILIINFLKQITTASEAFILSEQDAIASLISIAKGERWKDLSMMEIRGMILNAVEVAMDADCYGETLRRLTEAALAANARRWRRLEERHYQMIIESPTMQPVDFSKLSYN